MTSDPREALLRSIAATAEKVAVLVSNDPFDLGIAPRLTPGLPETGEPVWEETSANVAGIFFALRKDIFHHGETWQDSFGDFTPPALKLAAKELGIGLPLVQNGKRPNDDVRVLFNLAEISPLYQHPGETARCFRAVADALAACGNGELPAGSVRRIATMSAVGGLIAKADDSQENVVPLAKRNRPQLTAEPVCGRDSGSEDSEQEWQNARKTYFIGSSDLASCFPSDRDGKYPGWRTPDEQWEHILTGEYDPPNHMMVTGTKMQPTVEEYALAHPMLSEMSAERIDGGEEHLYAHPEIPACATPDMLVRLTYPDGSQEDAIVECKTTPNYYSTYYQETWQETTDGEIRKDRIHCIPYKTVLQVHWQMEVLGLETAYVAVFPTNEQYPKATFGEHMVFLHRVPRDPEIADKCMTFARGMISCVQRGVPPSQDSELYSGYKGRTGRLSYAGKIVPVSGEDRRPAPLVADDEILDMCRRRQIAAEKENKAKTEKEKWTDEIRKRMGVRGKIVSSSGDTIASLSNPAVLDFNAWLASIDKPAIVKEKKGGKIQKDGDGNPLVDMAATISANPGSPLEPFIRREKTPKITFQKLAQSPAGG